MACNKIYHPVEERWTSVERELNQLLAAEEGGLASKTATASCMVGVMMVVTGKVVGVVAGIEEELGKEAGLVGIGKD